MSQHPAKGHGYPLGFHPTCRCLSFSSLRLPEAGRKHSPCRTEAPEPRLPSDAAGKATHPRGQKRRDAVCPAARIRITLEGERGLQWKPRPGRLGVLGGPPSKCCGTSCRGSGVRPSLHDTAWPFGCSGTGRRLDPARRGRWGARGPPGEPTTPHVGSSGPVASYSCRRHRQSTLGHRRPRRAAERRLRWPTAMLTRTGPGGMGESPSGGGRAPRLKTRHVSQR